MIEGIVTEYHIPAVVFWLVVLASFLLGVAAGGIVVGLSAAAGADRERERLEFEDAESIQPLRPRRVVMEDQRHN